MFQLSTSFPIHLTSLLGALVNLPEDLRQYIDAISHTINKLVTRSVKVALIIVISNKGSQSVLIYWK